MMILRIVFAFTVNAAFERVIAGIRHSGWEVCGEIVHFFERFRY